jgi:hypothetical protein
MISPAFKSQRRAQPGNSGSPLVNAQRDIIGIVVAKLRGGELGNYVIKSSTALILLEDRAPPFPGKTVFVETAGQLPLFESPGPWRVLRLWIRPQTRGGFGCVHD